MQGIVLHCFGAFLGKSKSIAQATGTLETAIYRQNFFFLREVSILLLRPTQIIEDNPLYLKSTYFELWKWKSLSHVSLQPHGLYSLWNSPGKNTGVGSLSLLQQICSTQESKWGLLHYRWVLYQLSYQGNPFWPLIISTR